MGRLIKEVILGLAVTLLFFILVEGALRVVAWPPADTGDDPYVGFSRIKPLFQVHDGVVSTVPERLKYFNKVSFREQKPGDTFRIFCFGGSTTYGRPFDGRTAFSRWLQDLLQASNSEKTFEVINAGGISYASYRIVPLVKEALHYHPDLVIMYTGHNEFLERRTYAGLLSQGAGLVTVRSLLEHLYLYRALKRIIEPIMSSTVNRGAGTTGSPSSPRGNGKQPPEDAVSPKKSVLKDEVTAILDRSAGLDLYHRDEQFSKGVVTHFTHNLEAMIRMCRDAHVPVILVEPASNLRDFSPFKSEHREDLTRREKSALDERIKAATDLVRQRKYEEALGILDETIRKDPLYAETYYWKGKALLGEGKYEEARENLVKAKDLDVCPLRCITELQDRIAEIATRYDVPLISFKQAMQSRAREHGFKSAVPGNESFLDHVHPVIQGHQLLAELILAHMIQTRMVHQDRSLSPEEKAAVYRKGMETLDSKFFVTKDLNLAKVLKWAGKKDEARHVLQRAKGKLSNNPEVHKMLGGFLLEDGKFDEAIQEYTKAVQFSGNDPQLEFSLANAYYKAGLIAESRKIYEELLSRDEIMPEACANLAMIHLEDGKAGQALRILERGLAKTPNSEALFSPYALALAISGNPSKAIPWMVRAVRAEPGDPGNLYNLAGMYALSGKSRDALDSLDKAVDKGYGNADKLARDPVFSSIRDLPEFARILNRIQ
jgi:tetratricopeptide (TPR) repeat protein